MGVKLGNGKWAIKEDKLLAYNDNSGRFFNKEFDFSRGSSATYVAKDGLIKTAGLQATNLVNNGDFSELGSEIIIPEANSNFSSDTGYWTLETGVTIKNGKVNFTEAANNRSFYKGGLITVGKTYKLQITISGYVEGFIDSNNGNNFTFPSSNGTHTVYFVGGNPFLVLGANGTTSLSIDNISVKQVDPNDYWTITNNTGTDTIIKDGYAEIKTDGTFTQIAQSNILSIGKTYKLKYNVIQSDNGNLGLEIGGSTTLINSTVGTHTFIWTSNSSDLVFKRYSGALDISISNISVQEIQTDTPRIDFSDSVKGALLLEPQSTNLITYSEDFNVWQNGGGTQTIVANATTSPEGLQNASSIQIDSGYVYKQVSGLSISSGDQYTWSCYVNSSSQKIRFGGGTVGGTDVYSSEDVGNGWYRQKFTRTFTTSGSIIQPMFSDSISGTDLFYIWGAQLEAKSFSTSYIPTFGSSATRLADVCINSGSAQDFNSEEGVLYAEIAALANDGTGRRISLNDGTTNNTVEVRYTSNNNQIQFVIRDNGTVTVVQSINISNVLEFNKIALRYKADDCKMYINGVRERTDTNCTMPSGLNRLSFNWGGSNPFYGKVRAVQVFTEALTDEQLQKLTTI